MEAGTKGRGRTRKLSSTHSTRQRSNRVEAHGRPLTPMASTSVKGLRAGKKTTGKGTTNSSEGAHPLIRKVLTAKPPIAELIGFEVVEIGDGHAVGSLQAGPQHANPMGTLHGGVL